MNIYIYIKENAQLFGKKMILGVTFFFKVKGGEHENIFKTFSLLC